MQLWGADTPAGELLPLMVAADAAARTGTGEARATVGRGYTVVGGLLPQGMTAVVAARTGTGEACATVGRGYINRRTVWH